LVALRQFITVTETEIRSAEDLWALATTYIWKGGDPLPGQVKFTFWHVTFFAWFCNMAMHVGMSDLTVFRFARKSWYGVASAAGMYVGHFMAWLSASLLYALQLHHDPTNTDVLLIIAGWTTANPTIYRAGLAFQAIIPRSSRFVVTLLTGGVATIAGMFPAIAMQLLGFVALYGMILMPMGAVIFIDYWLIRKFGLQSSYAEVSRKSFNWAAGLTWFLTFGICVLLVKFSVIMDWLVSFGILADSERVEWLKETFTVQIFFVSLPGWFVAVVLYVLLSKLYQNRLHAPAVESVE
jgi:hypothetical protein